MTEKDKSTRFDVPPEVQQQVMVTTLDKIYNWSRRSSVWPMFFGLACCAIEMICTASSRFDISRFGMEVMRPSPRQVDLMIVSGTVTKKMIPIIVRLYNQMPEPKYVLAMGACASGGGPFKEGYNVVDGVDKFLPVDVYVPGCPPTPQALLHGLISLQKRIDAQSIKQVRWYSKGPLEAIPVPVLGPDLIDPREYELIKKVSEEKQQKELAASQPTDLENQNSIKQGLE
jgi:NADH-quinone oxidoreductase subunit B